MNKDGLLKLREPFPDNQISKLPKPTRQQTEEVKNNFKAGIRCQLCGGWHHPQVVHLDYVGHAALTDRLLDVDPEWNWEPLSVDERGQPVFDQIGGMWIKLTICGVTRLGYGNADGKKGGNAIKEVIGDCLRNSAMRYGAGLDLWHKGDLHMEESEEEKVESLGSDILPTDADIAGTISAINELIIMEGSDGVLKAWNKLTNGYKTLVWHKMSDETKEYIKMIKEI